MTNTEDAEHSDWPKTKISSENRLVSMSSNLLFVPHSTSVIVKPEDYFILN